MLALRSWFLINDIPWLIVFFIIITFLPYKEMTFLGEINQLLSVGVLT